MFLLGGIGTTTLGCPLRRSWLDFGRAISITDCGAVGDGVSDDSAAYAAAAAAADAAGRAVFIPADAVIVLAAGTHPLPSRGFVGGGELRGAPMTYAYNVQPSTILRADGSYGPAVPISSPTQGDTMIGVTNTFSAGDVLQVRDNTDVRADNRIEIAVVRASDGSAITLRSPLKYTYGTRATLRRIVTRGRYSDGGCRFRNLIVDIERYDGVAITGSYHAAKLYLSETINATVYPEVFDCKGANVWCGLSNCTRLFDVRGVYRSVDSTDRQGYVKLNCGVHDGVVDITAIGKPGTAFGQSGIHIDTYFRNNSRIDADYLACSNIRARCNAVGVDRSVFAASDPGLTAGAQARSWDLRIEGSGRPIAVQRIRDSHIVALTPETAVALYATTDSTVDCFARPSIQTLSGNSVENLEVNFEAHPAIVIAGQTNAGTANYSVSNAQTVYRGKWAETTVKVGWDGHTGTGNMLIQLTDVTPINNADRVKCRLLRTTAADIERLEFSSTSGAETPTPTNTFVLREAARAGGGLADVTAAGVLQFVVRWKVGLWR